MKLKTLATFLYIGIALILLFSIPLHPKSIDKEKIIFFHTNDMHGAIKTMGKIYSIVNSERDRSKNVFLVNTGDNFSGNPAVDQYEPKGEPMLILMNRLKFDIMALGNHDFDYGQKVLKSFTLRAGFPILCANIQVEPTLDFPKPYPYFIYRTVNGTDVVFLGLIQIDEATGLPSTLPEWVEGITFSRGRELVKKYLFLKRDNNVLVIISHLGVEEDTMIAREFGNIDLIIGGHSHTKISNPKEINGTLVVQAGSYARYLGKVELELENGKIILKRGKLINLSKVHTEDAETKKLADKFNNNPALNKIIAKFEFPVRGRRDLGLMVCDGIRSSLGLDIIFYNEGGIRIDELSGNVTVKDIYSMHPFGNYIVELKMTAKEIGDLIKNDYISHNGLDLIPSGLSYRVVKDLQDRIIEVELFDPSGKELSDEITFRVGLNNYIFTSYKFRHKDPGRSLNIKTVDIILDYLKKKPKLVDYSKIIRSKELTIFSGSLDTIGKTETEIITKASKFDSVSNTGNLVSDSIKDYSGSDIAIFPTRLLRTGVLIEAGKNIFTEHLPALFSHIKENRIIRVRMSGKTLRGFLLSRFQVRNNIDVHISGITCEIKRDRKGKVNSVRILTIKGKKLSLADYYNVSFVDYDFNRYYKFPGKISQKNVSEESIFTILRKYIKKVRTISSNINEERIFFKK